MLNQIIGLWFSRERVICESSSRKYIHHFLPGLLVFFLINCIIEGYNTAKVNTQTIVKVKVVNKAEDEPESFAWSWRPETIDDTRLLAMGEGSQWAQYYVFNYVFEKNVNLHPGKNIISLWSATVRFPATFKAPLGTDQVAVDIQGEGHAWISGHSIGRHWPSYLSYDTDCSLDACAYRGSYDNKYSFNCRSPTRRWYHVARSFMQDGENAIVLFGEFGGNPSLVNFQTIQVGAVTAHACEKHTVELACEGSISATKFASFGNPQGTCGSFDKGSCDSASALSILQKECVGKEKCSIDVSDSKFGSTNCGDAVKRLAV